MAFVAETRTGRAGGWLNRLIATPSFQELANRLPGIRRVARKDGAEIFDIVQGFVRSQVLFALVSLDIPERMLEEPVSVDMLALTADVPADRLGLLLQAGAGLGLFRKRRDGRFSLTRKGAALVGVPGLKQMILHHGAFYRDMSDPLALLKGEVDTELAQFWPYVFGANGDVAQEVTETYSDLMADSQRMVARDTLATVSLTNISHLMDVGGGSGAFLAEVSKVQPSLQLTLFDLAAVMPSARLRLSKFGLERRIGLSPGSFKDDPLPKGPDAISLVRVLYDHSDETVQALLAKVFETLPPGGRLIISEPMSGGAHPDPITDVYFAFYTLSMQTGRTRSAVEIQHFCEQAGFLDIRVPRPRRSFVTSVLTARKPE
ncbi:MAG: methyltransferase [Pseudomonadota bacterium]